MQLWVHRQSSIAGYGEKGANHPVYPSSKGLRSASDSRHRNSDIDCPRTEVASTCVASSANNAPPITQFSRKRFSTSSRSTRLTELTRPLAYLWWYVRHSLRDVFITWPKFACESRHGRNSITLLEPRRSVPSPPGSIPIFDGSARAAYSLWKAPWWFRTDSLPL